MTALIDGLDRSPLKPMKIYPTTGRDCVRAYFVAIEASTLGLAIASYLDENTRIRNGPFPVEQPWIYTYGCVVLLILLLLTTILSWIWRRDLAVAATCAFTLTVFILIVAPNFLRA